MSHHLVFSAVFGVSGLTVERAERLLGFELGRRRDGSLVTVAVMLTLLGIDPEFGAQRLMLVDPLVAVGDLTRLVARLQIDGVPATDPAAVARAALSHAGRAVTWWEIHPEVVWLLRLVERVGRWFKPGGSQS